MLRIPLAYASRVAVTLERHAAFYADQLFDGEGVALEVAATRWRDVGRSDRADFLLMVANEQRKRGM